jgi:hypothetical protein
MLLIKIRFLQEEQKLVLFRVNYFKSSFIMQKHNLAIRYMLWSERNSRNSFFKDFICIQGVTEISALILTGNRTHQKEQLFSLPFWRKTLCNGLKK